MSLPNFNEFMEQRYPPNSYVNHPGFRLLYLKKSEIGVIIGDEFSYCSNVVTIGNLSVFHPGRGTFRKLVDDLLGLDKAVYVECVHGKTLPAILEHMEFTQVNIGQGLNYLKNYAGHLHHTRKIALLKGQEA